MVTQSRDTKPEAEKILIALLKQTPLTRKMEQVFSLSSSILRLAKRGISKANPDLNEDEKNILFIQVHYGNELAEKFQAFISKNDK